MMIQEDLLQRTVELNKMAKDFGFVWDNPHQLLHKIQEEYHEVLEVIDDPQQRSRLKDELGDLLHAVLSLSMVCELSPQQVLQGALAKVKKRFDMMVDIARAEGHQDFKRNLSMEAKLAYWWRAKETLQKQTGT